MECASEHLYKSKPTEVKSDQRVVFLAQARGCAPDIKWPLPETKVSAINALFNYCLTQSSPRSHFFFPLIMHILLHLNLYTLALFFLSLSVFAATIPQSTSLTTSTTSLQLNTSNLNTTASNSAFVCKPRGLRVQIEPTFADCAGVLRSLPLDPTVGTFYNTGGGDFQLPYFESFKTCQVLVELAAASNKVRSSWLAVQVAALSLNAACEDVRLTPGLGYAYTYVDPSTLMKITLQGLRR